MNREGNARVEAVVRAELENSSYRQVRRLMLGIAGTADTACTATARRIMEEVVDYTLPYGTAAAAVVVAAVYGNLGEGGVIVIQRGCSLCEMTEVEEQIFASES